jgi:hypothetical protein
MKRAEDAIGGRKKQSQVFKPFPQEYTIKFRIVGNQLSNNQGRPSAPANARLMHDA